MLRGVVVVFLAVLLTVLSHGAAFAHAHLKTSLPAAGATVATGASEARLQFNEAVEPALSKISVEVKGGKPVAAQPPVSDPADKATLIVKFSQPLPAGSYEVNWQVVSADTHKVKGSFSFQVRP